MCKSDESEFFFPTGVVLGLTLTPPQITGAFRALGDCLMTIINGVGTVLMTIINAVLSVCRTIVRFLTCGYCGRSGGRVGGGGMRSHGMRSHRRRPARAI